MDNVVDSQSVTSTLSPLSSSSSSSTPLSSPPVSINHTAAQTISTFTTTTVAWSNTTSNAPTFPSTSNVAESSSVRTSARVAAVRLRQQQQQLQQQLQAQEAQDLSSSIGSKGKGKASVRRPRRSGQTQIPQPPPIPRPQQDSKKQGKKRARPFHLNPNAAAASSSSSRHHQYQQNQQQEGEYQEEEGESQEEEEEEEEESRPPPRKRPRTSLSGRARVITMSSSSSSSLSVKKARGKKAILAGDAGPSRARGEQQQEDVEMEMGETSDFGMEEEEDMKNVVLRSLTLEKGVDREGEGDEDEDEGTIDVPIVKREASNGEGALLHAASGSPSAVPTSIEASGSNETITASSTTSTITPNTTTNTNTNNTNNDNDGTPTSPTPTPPVLPPPTDQAGDREQAQNQTLSSLMATDTPFHFQTYLATLGTRLKTILATIKSGAPANNNNNNNPSTTAGSGSGSGGASNSGTASNNNNANIDRAARLVALQDLSEILSMSTEDNLNGYFAVDEFVRVLVGVMGGTGGEGEGDEDDEGDGGDGGGGDQEGDDGDDGDDQEGEPVVRLGMNQPTELEPAATQPSSESATLEPPPTEVPATALIVAPLETPAEPEPAPLSEATEQAPIILDVQPSAEGAAATAQPQPRLAESAPAVEQNQTVEQNPVIGRNEPSSTSVPTLEQPPEQASVSNAEPSNATIPESAEPTLAATPEPAAVIPESAALTPEPAAVISEPATNAMMVDMMADMDEDAALAAALAMSAGDAGLDLAALGMGDMGMGLGMGDMGMGMGGMGQENLEEQLLACRCLANLMEAMPGSAHTLVYHGAVPVLCSKLLQITFIDLAEQTISTLEKLSEEYPSAIVREGGLSALLSYLDFFSTHVQRTALQAAANCCRNMSVDSFSAIKEVFPTLRAVLSYSDQRLVEYAALCVIRTIESFARGATESLEGLLSEGVVKDIMNLLVPGGSSGGGGGAGAGGGGGGGGGAGPGGAGGSGGAMISSGTMTLFLRALSTAAKNSPKIALTLLEGGMAGTVYTILTGVLPPNDLARLEGEQGGGEGGQGVGSGLADMAVMQNLAGRPKEMVEEALSLVCELMPPLPRDGVFDPRGYTEKSVSRAIKSRMKDAKGRPGTSTVGDTNETLGDSNAVASSSNPAPLSSNNAEGDADADTDADGPSNSPVKTEPHEVDIADMLMVPEPETENATLVADEDVQMDAEPAPAVPDANAAPAIVPDQDVVMGGDAEPVPAEVAPVAAGEAQVDATAPLDYNPAMTNAEGEPLMAMMTDEAVADLPNAAPPPPAGESQDSQPPSSSQPEDAPPVIPPDIAAAVAGASSSRHRHGESSTTQARLKLLREKPEVVSRFLFLVVPILFDVYSASVTLQVRLRCFLGILKATSFVDGPGMELLYKEVPVASFVGSILTSKDNPTLVTNALQLVELLLVKSPSVFRSSLRKEGVLHEVSTISKIELKIKAKPVPPPADPPSGDTDANPSEEGSVPPPVPVIVSRKSSSVPSDPQDAYVLRARFIKVKYLSGSSDAGGDAVFESLKTMIKALGDTEATSEQLSETLKEIAKLFGSSGATISSFELLKSGLVDGLLAFATESGRAVDVEKRKDLFLDAFSARSGYATPPSQTPLAVLVKRLQESLTRMESFDVVTTSPGSMDDAKRSSMALISRTLRLKLAAEDPADVPKSCHSLMVSIHAIAPFSALEDYLKPRIAGILSFRPELSPGLLQALAGSGLPSSTLAQSMLARLTARVGSGSSGSSGAGAAGTLSSFLSAITGPGSTESGPSTPATATAGTASGSLPIPIPSRRGTGESGSSASTSEPPPPPSAISEGILSRRRSLRLRGQPPADPQASTSTNAEAPAQASTSAPIPAPTAASSETRAALTSSLLHQLLSDEAELEDDLDGEIGEEGEEMIADRTFNLAFDAANGGLTASTPQGTRIATPLNGTTPTVDAPIASLALNAAGSSSTAPKMSYAGVAASAIEKATDFHLEFRLNDEVLPMDMTVYGACHQYESRRSSDGQPNPHAVWNGNYTITYRKIPGKRPVRETGKDSDSMETDLVAGLTPESPPSKILRLLRVLYRINAEGIEHLDSKMKIVTIPDAAFINNKLTAKLARQLEEIMILASNCLPDWALDLPQAFGFLFPFSTRYLFLQSTSFGYARLLNRVISQTPRDAPNNSRRDGLDQYGRLQRRKVEVPRDSPMQVALKVFDLFGSSSSILDVHFQGEVGTGLGPTLEFFASVCREFAWRDLKLWRDADSTLSGRYVHHPLGLFPAPMLNLVVDGPMATERDRRKLRLYRLLGQFVARSLLDSRIIDVSFNKIFLKLILGDHVPLTITSIKVIDPTLGSSLATLQQFVDMKREIEGTADITSEETAKRISKLDVKGVTLDDMCLDFTVPGYDDLELKPSGKDINVTANNVEEYIDLTIDAIMGRGARPAIQAFKTGFSTVFPVSDLRTFSAEELVMMFGNADEDWSTETLSEAIKADHGFNVESKAIRDLIEIMTLYDKNSRRDFLQFLTGSPKLPIGGFKALNPQLTVVRKPHESPLTPDDYLPSVMTCAHYLKLPSYSSRAVMEKKLMMAMREGTGSFHLS